MKHRFALAGSALLGFLLFGCGNSGPSDCARFADGLARAWNKCGKQEYAPAMQDIEGQCNEANKPFDEGKLNQCLSDLGTADCSVIMSGIPPSCNDIHPD